MLPGLKLSIQQRSTKNIKNTGQPLFTSFYIFFHLFISFYTYSHWSDPWLAGQGKKTTNAETAGHTGTAGFGTGLWVAEPRFLNQCYVHYDFTIGFLCISLFVGCFLARASSLVRFSRLWMSLNVFDGCWMILASFGIIFWYSSSLFYLPQLPLSPQLTQTPLAWLWSHRSSSIKFLSHGDGGCLASLNTVGLLWFGSLDEMFWFCCALICFDMFWSSGAGEWI